MQSIIQKQREYSAELASATAALGKNATAQERATSVAPILRKQIQNQESAISAQNLMLQKAVNKYGEASVQASKFRTSMYNTNAELQTLKSRLSEAESGLESFSDKASDSGDSLQGSITAGMLAAKAYETVGKTLLDAGKQVVQVGISYNAQLEQYQTALTNMLGSSEEAQSILEEIKQDAARTPFDTAGLVKANELLISTGVDAESSRKTILALGDAVSATGGGNDELSRMAQNLQQIKNAGKATAADIKQFAYAGIDVYGLLADYTGKSTAEVQSMTVSYDLLTAALEKAADEGGRYYNSMQTQSETLNGQMSTLKDNATQLAGLMTEDLTDGIKMVVSNVNDLTVAATEAYKTDGWVGLLDAITDCMGPIASLKTQFESFASSSISWLDQLSYKLNKALGKDAYAGYDSYEDYRNAADLEKKRSESNREAERKRRLALHESRVAQSKAQKAASGGTGTTVSPSGGGGGSGNSPKKAVADQQKLANSVTKTSTKLLEGTGNIVGAIKQVTETADNTYNVYDGTTKQLKGTTEETAQTITRSWTEMVDGVQKNYKQVVTLLDGVEQSSKTTIEGVQAASKTSVGTKTEKIYGVDGVVGALDRTTTTTKKIEQVLDETTGELKDTVTSTTDVVTDSYTAIIDGIAQTVERTTTYVDGVVTDVQEKTSGLKEEIVGIQGTVGSFSQFILDLDTKLGGLEQAASNLTKSPLGNWFSDLKKGYRASDSFFDNIDVFGLLVGGVTSFATGYSNGGVYAGIASAALSVAGNLLGTNLSGLVDESNNWGGDIVKGMANGIKENAGKLATAAKNIADKIAEYIHFSRPDVGPLREYEKWMPDMIDGMAKGIKDNAYVLRDAAKGLSGQIETQLTYDVGRFNAAMSAAYTNRRINMGGVSLNIYPPSGMDAEEIAQYTIDKLQMMVNAEAAANGEIPVL
nr:MAG TPA: tail tape measure protein [Caudoviricetes sp.]